MQERLQKIIARAGVTSRRKAEELIRQGQVLVNGRLVSELGCKADAEHDHIRVCGRMLKDPAKRIHILLNKPAGYVSTASDPEGRPTVVSLLNKHGIHTRIYPVGRLDYHSSGLILVTNDGDFASLLLSRDSAIPRTYHAKLEGCPRPEDLLKLERGIVLEGRRTAPAQIRPLAQINEKKKPWYEITLVEGRYRQVRRMFEYIRCPVVRLKRVRIGFLTDQGLAPGTFRYLTPAEVSRLKNRQEKGSEEQKHRMRREDTARPSGRNQSQISDSRFETGTAAKASAYLSDREKSSRREKKLIVSGTERNTK